MKKHDQTYKPNMHRAICSECGSSCEVPFKPSNDKPIYCSECFSKKNNEGGGRRDGGRRDDRRNDRRGGGRDFRKDDRQRICSVCGETCSLPFNPTPGKKVYCDLCFSKKNEKENTSNSITAEQFNIINSKLNAILKSLNPSSEKTETEEVVKKEKKKEKKPITKKPVAKKPVIKKEKTTKPVAKKTPKKPTPKKTPTKAKAKTKKK
jgi:CxxC-x17-CxxC domain-containing protein